MVHILYYLFLHIKIFPERIKIHSARIKIQKKQFASTEGNYNCPSITILTVIVFRFIYHKEL